MENLGLLSYVKKVVHSLVVSTPDRMTVEQLKRDYANEEGSSVPFIKLGFRDIESFLRSIPDTIKVCGYGPMAEVIAQTHAKTAHIQNLVQSQKRPSNKNRNRRGGPKPKFIYPSERSDLVFINENRRHHSNSNFDNTKNRKIGCLSNSSSYYNVQQSRQVHSAPVRNGETLIVNSLNKLKIKPVDDESSVDSFEVYAPNQPDNLQRVQNSAYTAGNDEVPISNKVKQPTTDQHISSDDGLDGDAIPAYAVARDDQVMNVKCNKNIERKTLINVETKVNVAEKSPYYNRNEIEYVSSDEGSDAEAIPIYAVDERVINIEYPKNAVHFDQHLPSRDIQQKVKLHDYIEVQIVSVSNPHSFYFWIHDEQYDDYKAMSTNMQRFYNNIDDKRYTIPLFLIMPGHLGVIYSNDTIWERVKVLNLRAGNRKNIEVELIDTGDRDWVCHSSLKYLCKDFATLPSQCWPGRLACIAPQKGTQFSANVSNSFYELVSYRRLFAKIQKIGDMDKVTYMVLVDADADAAIKNINLLLIDSGWVRRSMNP